MASRVDSLRHPRALLSVLLQSTIRNTDLLRNSSLSMACLPDIYRYSSTADLTARRENLLQGASVPRRERDSADTEWLRDVEVLDADCTTDRSLSLWKDN